MVEHTLQHTTSTTESTAELLTEEITRLSDANLYKQPHSTVEKYQDATDDELIAAYLGGDTNAFTAIITRHHRMLWWAARRHVDCDHDAEDVLQETLLTVSRSLDKYSGYAKLRTWLYRLVCNAAYDYRHRVIKKEVAELDDPEGQYSRDSRISYDPLKTHAETMTVNTVVNSLPTEHRDAIILMDFQGYNLTQAAELQGVKPGTIKSRRARAKAQIREMLGEIAG
ncbi:DNA-directed RNA polymerase specialized sigma subunit, sigma24 [Corynebacterium mustelae]|uniref:DNA-directed RNA polymerase specialized sigma subunit, sigma24 n=1 Tax=Corynebacterium mustelae TaxID=571915 RepID=A0A0G3H1S6_9CORY|nr:sigma-70 family RNA polymerase sigma factor [Corynebacterium mustelae]AKK07369.1 DNA-directed RNA polymerase specialized sigma subunit, sigma24 [Corynebacterium mustelae]